MHQNNVFFCFFKFIFDISKSKRSKQKKKLSKNKFKFWANSDLAALPNTLVVDRMGGPP
jgi:hypothetical protein